MNCGAELPASPQLYKRKYCSASCANKYQLRLKKPDVQTKLWQHAPAVFESAMEMYWDGISSAAIARNFEIPVGTVYSWVHDFGGQRERGKPPRRFIERPIHNWSLKEYFRLAGSADEWLEILRSNASQSEESHVNATVKLVCGKLHGQSVNKLAGVIYEKLKDDPLNGKTYAFCNNGQNTITTIVWNEPVYHIGRYIKAYGTFIWPHEKLGSVIEITKAEFDHLIYLKKSLRKQIQNAEKACVHADFVVQSEHEKQC